VLIKINIFLHEEMLNILGLKGNVNQNDIEISPHSSQNGYQQNHKQLQMLARTGRGEGKEPLYTVDGNVN
jgi:hypothetical protein